MILRTPAVLPLLLTLAFVAIPAHASTTVSISGQFVENGSAQVSCTADICGSGWMKPFGEATDTDVFNGCGPGCNLKFFDFGDGNVLVLDEIGPTNLACSNPFLAGNGSCGGLSGQTTNSVDSIRSTGIFVGASGPLLNTFTVAHDAFRSGNNAPGSYSAIARYSGTVTLG